MRILLAGNINSLLHREQVAAVKAAFAALPFEEKITTVYYMSGTRGAANAHLKNRFTIVDLEVSIEMYIDAVVVVAVEASAGGQISIHASGSSSENAAARSFSPSGAAILMGSNPALKSCNSSATMSS